MAGMRQFNCGTEWLMDHTLFMSFSHNSITTSVFSSSWNNNHWLPRQLDSSLRDGVTAGPYSYASIATLISWPWFDLVGHDALSGRCSVSCLWLWWAPHSTRLLGLTAGQETHVYQIRFLFITRHWMQTSTAAERRWHWDWQRRFCWFVSWSCANWSMWMTMRRKRCWKVKRCSHSHLACRSWSVWDLSQVCLALHRLLAICTILDGFLSL